MGTTPTTPTKSEVVVEADGITTYNASPYTGYSSEEMIVQDYPYILWEPDTKLGEQYELRLILEITLWATAAVIIEFLTHISAFAILIDPNCCESDLNKISVYTVDVAFYWAEGFM